MEEEKGLKKYGYLFATGSIVAAFLFLFGCVIQIETKYYIGETKVKEYFNWNLINLLNPNNTKIFPMIFILVLLGSALIFVLLAGLLNKKLSSKIKDGFIATSMILLLLAICFIFASKEILVYFASNSNPEIVNFNGASLGWGAAVSIAFIAITILFEISYSSYSEQTNIKVMAEDGLLIAAAFVLNFVKIPLSVTGGSINFQMLPLMIIALRRGPLQGLISGGIIYGLLTCLTDGYGFATYPFDYLIGFGSVAILGFFRSVIINADGYNWKGELFILVGGTLSTLLRFIGSTVSSIVVYEVDFVGALAYNAIYIPVSGALAIAVLMAVYGPLLKINKRFPADREAINA